MKILALIPARGGSKRLPGKNIKLLGGIPLIAWSIRTAIDSECCTDVLVSTDDSEIAEVSRAYGACVPWLRPAALSDDTSSSVDVALHALELYEAEHGMVDGLLLLQPTSPFRSVETIQRAVSAFKKWGMMRPVVSVSSASCHPSWCFRASEDALVPFLNAELRPQRSQDLEPAWMLNGSVYLISPERLRADHQFLTTDTVPLFIEGDSESVDIDTPADWLKAEFIIKTEFM